jgi:hypothetical protein
MAALEELLAKLDSTLNKLLTKLGGNSQAEDNGGRGGAAGVASGFDLQKTMGDAATALGEVASNGVGVVSVFKAIGGSKDAVMDALQTLAQYSKVPGAGTAVELLKGRVEPNIKANESGKDTDLIKQGAQELGTKVSYADFQKWISQNQPGLSGAGSLQNDRVDNLYKTLQLLIESNRSAIAAGRTTPEQLARALLLSQQKSRSNLATDEGREEAVKSSTRLAKEIDSVSARIGEDRNVISQQTAERMKQGDMQATLQLLQSQQQKEQFIRTQQSLAGFGTSVQDLAKEYVQFGGAVSKEAQATSVRIGPQAANELRESMLQLKNATTEKGRQDAEDRLERAKMAINERQISPEAARGAIMANAFPEEEILQSFKKGFEENREAAGYQYNRQQGMSPEAAQSNVNLQVRNLQAGKGQFGTEPTEGQRFMGAVLEGNINAAQGAAGAMHLLNTELNKNKGIVNEVIKGVNDLTKLPVLPKEVSSSGGKEEKKEEKEGPKEKPSTRPGGTALGTLGVTGATFEPKDIFSLIHKGERVLNPKENTDLTNLYSLVSQIKPKENLGGALKDINPIDDSSAEESTTSASKKTNIAGVSEDTITLKDVNDSLQQLNSNIELMVSHTSEMKEHTKETADMSGKMTGNRLAV